MFRKKIRRLLYEFLRINLIPSRFLPKKLYYFKENWEIFQKEKKICYSEKGYYYISPRVSKKELDNYYKKIYNPWRKQPPENLLIKRDIEHYLKIKEVCPELFIKKINFMNVGSGHGGISNIFALNENKVVNVDPVIIDYSYNKMIQYEDIENIDIKELYDLIYSSHFIHMGTDMERLINRIINLTKPGGFIFLETINGGNKLYEAINGNIRNSFTFYPTINYFKTLDRLKIINLDLIDFKRVKTKKNDEGIFIQLIAQKVK
tara:strand:+ start:5108 stop:5893 length:786 start_codon:yes stop_codon:yes gene_type:complete